MIFRGIRRSDRPFSDPGEARTLDPLIKSQLLYQLSYGVFICASFLNCGAKLSVFFGLCKFDEEIMAVNNARFLSLVKKIV